MHRNGTIRILVAGTDRLLQAAPDIPISAEAGYPDLITVQFMGVFAPGDTPRPIIEKIAAVSRDAMTDKDFQKRLIDDGFESLTDSGPEQAAKFIQEELMRWTPLLKASVIKVN